MSIRTASRPMSRRIAAGVLASALVVAVPACSDDDDDGVNLQDDVQDVENQVDQGTEDLQDEVDQGTDEIQQQVDEGAEEGSTGEG